MKNRSRNFDIEDYTESDVNSLDFQEGGKYEPKKLAAYEKDFQNIYNEARDYSRRLNQLIKNEKSRELKLRGGQDAPVKEKKKLNEKIALMHEITKYLKAENKAPDLIQSSLMKTSSYIIDEAKRNLKSDKITEEVRNLSFQIAKNPNRILEQVREELKNAPPKQRKSKKKRSQKGGQYDDNEYDIEDDRLFQSYSNMQSRTHNNSYQNQDYYARDNNRNIYRERTNNGYHDRTNNVRDNFDEILNDDNYHLDKRGKRKPSIY